MPHKIKTKILCTLGPSTWSKGVLSNMIKSGMTLARVNGAYADIEELDRVGTLVRSISDDVALILDIKGTEVRLNKFENEKQISIGDKIVIGNSEKDELYPITYPNLYTDLKKGDELLIDDGRVKIKVTDIKDKKIHTIVKYGKVIKPGKTINTPGIPLTNPPITPRDIEQIDFAVENDWDFIAASFVRNKDDILQVQKRLKGKDIGILAKIEDAQGVENIDEILEVASGVIIARGDLGVEMPFEQVPIIQKQLTEICLEQAKPAIVATQMLESMIENPNPTRAEINDVSTSILDGVDAVWLSAETSTGKYPLEAVTTLNLVAKEAEKHMYPEVLYSEPNDINPVTVALCRAAIDILETTEVDKIIVATGSGRTARLLSTFKPDVPIIALCPNGQVKNQLLASWGVTPYVYETDFYDRDEGIQNIIKKSIDVGAVKRTDKVIVIRGTHPGDMKTNSLEVGVAGKLLKKH